MRVCHGEVGLAFGVRTPAAASHPLRSAGEPDQVWTNARAEPRRPKEAR